MSNKRTSAMWNFFTILDAQKQSAKCNLCKQVLSYKSSVTNLKRHILSRHPTVNILPNNERSETVSKNRNITPTPSTSSALQEDAGPSSQSAITDIPNRQQVGFSLSHSDTKKFYNNEICDFFLFMGD